MHRKTKNQTQSTTIKQRRECVDPPFYPLAHVILSILSILHNSSLVGHCYSYNLPFLTTLETLVEGFIWPLIMTLGNLELDLGFSLFYFIFKIASLNIQDNTLKHYSDHLKSLKHFFFFFHPRLDLGFSFFFLFRIAPLNLQNNTLKHYSNHPKSLKHFFFYHPRLLKHFSNHPRSLRHFSNHPKSLMHFSNHPRSLRRIFYHPRSLRHTLAHLGTFGPSKHI